jgi:transposase-like protein
MGLSRRQFTKEFKLAAIQRLESGARLAEVARAFEVNPSLLHRWQREFRQGPGNVFPGLTELGAGLDRPFRTSTIDLWLRRLGWRFQKNSGRRRTGTSRRRRKKGALV